MSVFDYAIQDSVLMCAPHTLLLEIIIYMGEGGKYIGTEDGLFATAHSLDISYRSLRTTVEEKSIPALNCLTVGQEIGENQVIPLIDCVYIVERSQLLGIFTLADLFPLIKEGINLASVTISQVMKEPMMTLEKDFDVNQILSLMSKSDLRHFPIVDDKQQLLGVVTPESLALRLQQELSETRERLQWEIAQRCSLELAIKKAEEKLEKRVAQALKMGEERYTRAISAGIVGIWEWNIQTNEIYIDPNLKAMLGYSEEEDITYFENWLDFVHPDDVEVVKKAVNDFLAGLTPKYEIEHRMLNKNGSYIWFLARGTLVRDAKGDPCFMAGSNTDITARTQVENQLKASLKEKDVLLKEIHHRVKNNLQIISSLLRLQTKYIHDQQALDMFQDSHNRVQAMAMIHEKLYQSSNLATIEISDYIENLTNSLIRSYGVNCNIKIHLKVDKIGLKINTAIPCGLIINELISNSIKHAFVDKDSGDIYVDFRKLPQNKYLLTVSDNGVGLPKDIEIQKNRSLGLQLVWNLVEQLEGTITFNTSLGTLFTITFVEIN